MQDHAADAARAWIHTVTLEAFVRAVEACGDEDVRRVLNLVCDLFALQNIEADKGFFQEHGRLSSPRTKQVTREVNRLCNEVRGQAGLIDRGRGYRWMKVSLMTIRLAQVARPDG